MAWVLALVLGVVLVLVLAPVLVLVLALLLVMVDAMAGQSPARSVLQCRRLPAEFLQLQPSTHVDLFRLGS